MYFIAGIVLLVVSIVGLLLSRPGKDGVTSLSDTAAVGGALIITFGFSSGIGLVAASFF